MSTENPTSDSDKGCGWSSDLPRFHTENPYTIRHALEGYIRDASPEQVRAWDQSIPMLQREAGEILQVDSGANEYTAILEYTLPLEYRRPDMVVLLAGPVVVVELKGKRGATQADIDQVSAYARDLRSYHKECHGRRVEAVLVPALSTNTPSLRDGVHIVGPGALDSLLTGMLTNPREKPVTADAFLSPDAYSPLPMLVEAARELFHSGSVRSIWRATASTEPAVNVITEVAHEAATKGGRHLILVTGVPGSGKTLVGLRAVHAHHLDDLVEVRGSNKPFAPAVFLSGNDPLVSVLQYELRSAGGGGKTFVRSMREYMRSYMSSPNKIPPEHLIVFDEAQRAYSKDAVARTHERWGASEVRSEPEHLIDICNRIPKWCVLVGLVGEGQEIHVGEEEGLAQWARAIEESPEVASWSVHAPPAALQAFHTTGTRSISRPELSLDAEIRFHLTQDYHKYIAGLLSGDPTISIRPIADQLQDMGAPGGGGVRLLLSRDLESSKQYLRDRYSNDPRARFGILASSKDKVLSKNYGIPNDYQSTKRLRIGPWYGENEGRPGSCRNFESVATEFQCQGLELDMALVAWGTDLIRRNGEWSNLFASKYRVPARDPLQLRLNAYRVLLTRGRDGLVVFVPPEPDLDETYAHLAEAGFKILASDE